VSDQEVIKDFLISLGFKTDEASHKKFANNIAWATAKVNLLAQAVLKAGEAVYDSGKEFVKGMESLYYAGQRTGASVTGIESFTFAVEALGGSAQEALSSLEGVGRFLRTVPGAEGFIHALGVQTRDANGELRDTAETMIDIGKRLANMDMPHANAYANVLGIDEKTLIAMRSGEFEAAFRKRQKMAQGADFQKAAAQSREFMNVLREVGEQFTVMGAKAEIAILARALPALKRFSNWLESSPVSAFLENLSNLTGAGIDALADAIEAIADSLGNMLSSLDLGSLDDLTSAFHDLWEAIKVAGEGLGDLFGPTLKATLQGIADVVQIIAQGLGAFGNLVTGDTDKLAERGSKIGSIASNLLGDFQGIGKGILGSIGIGTGDQLERSTTVQQKTEIHVHGADAASAGQSVAREQDRVNQRMVRNLKGAVR